MIGDSQEGTGTEKPLEFAWVQGGSRTYQGLSSFAPPTQLCSPYCLWPAEAGHLAMLPPCLS